MKTATLDEEMRNPAADTERIKTLKNAIISAANLAAFCAEHRIGNFSAVSGEHTVTHTCDARKK